MNDGTVVIDSSALVAIFRDEPDSLRLAERAMSYARRVISTATWLESAIVCEGATPRGGQDRFERIIATLSVEMLPFTHTQAKLALDAFKQFGKGRGAKASLNFGDCFAYALAKELGAPLLFKGHDFSQTDLHPA